MPTNLTKARLFGGAIVALIPSQFADVSTIRQVPDNQEVYLDTDGFTSLSFDITERVSHLPTDKEALEYHLADIVAEEDSREVLSMNEGVKTPHFQTNIPILSLTAKITPPTSSDPGPSAPVYTLIYLALIRLAKQATDLVIALNIPTMLDSREMHDEAASRELILNVVRSFEIKDWTLFND